MPQPPQLAPSEVATPLAISEAYVRILDVVENESYTQGLNVMYFDRLTLRFVAESGVTRLIFVGTNLALFQRITHAVQSANAEAERSPDGNTTPGSRTGDANESTQLEDLVHLVPSELVTPMAIREAYERILGVVENETYTQGVNVMYFDRLTLRFVDDGEQTKLLFTGANVGLFDRIAEAVVSADSAPTQSTLEPVESDSSAPEASTEAHIVPISTPSSLSLDEEMSLSLVCQSARFDGPVALRQCQERQLELLGGVPAVDLSGLSWDDEMSLNLVCQSAKFDGPVALRQCQQRQLELLESAPIVDLSVLSWEEEASVDLACQSARFDGPAALRQCQAAHMDSGG